MNLQAQINASIAVGSAGFVIPAGAYYFDNGAPLIIYRAKNWSLTSDGHVELWFKVSQHWSTGGVLILECTDISIDGITVDYDPPTHYQGTVLNTNADRANGMVSAMVKTDQGFPEHTGSNDPSNEYMNAPGALIIIGSSAGSVRSISRSEISVQYAMLNGLWRCA